MACIHELDVVRLRAPAWGKTPDGDSYRVPAGSEGTVIVETPGSDIVEIEISDPESGRPIAFAAAARDALEVVWRATTGSAA